jgi:hypothetical protein
MLKSRIFISSGQKNDSADHFSERQLVASLRTILEDECNFEVYTAIEQHSLEGFTKNILENLEKSEYFLFIDFRREKIKSSEEYYRGSLFSHQELGIAVYLKKKHVLLFQEDGVEKRNGIINFIQANPISFADRSKLNEEIINAIQKEKWHTGWRNEIQLNRTPGEYQEVFYHPIQRTLRFFHITVNNLHDSKAASDCLVYLRNAVNMENNVSLLLPHYELKWRNVTEKSVMVLPSQGRDFDALFVDHFSEPKIHFGFNMFLVDYPNIMNEYRLHNFGDYELTFEVVSREFTSKAKFHLHFEANIQNISLTQIQ